MNYTVEQAKLIKDTYLANPTRETVEKLAKDLDKPLKSIIGKLSREGIYRREVYKTKTGEDPITKLEIVSMIAEKLDISCEKLIGLEKSPKQVLKLILSVIE